MNEGQQERCLHKWMKKALEQADEALLHGEVAVGCVIVYEPPSGEESESKLITYGRNETNMKHNVRAFQWSIS